MKFSELIAPVKMPEFKKKILAGETFVIKGKKKKFSHLISLAEIEAVLNNGCNTNLPVEMIVKGGRGTVADTNILWAPVSLRKKEILQLINEKNSMLMRNMSQITPRVAAMIDEIETVFEGAHADVHLYMSLKKSSSGYNAHRDRPQHKLYLQVIGSTMWKVFSHSNDLDDEIVSVKEEDEWRYLKQEKEFTLEAGDMLYMPPATFHKVRNEDGPRISLSIPFYVPEKPYNRMDRTYIPFKKIFESRS